MWIFQQANENDEGEYGLYGLGRLFFFCQCKYEFQSASLIVLGGDVAAVDNNGVLYNSQSQSCSA